jgi:hypothetical protein
MVEKFPKPQFRHELDEVALEAVEYIPDEQLIQGGAPVDEYIPPVQVVEQLLEPTEDALPLSHSVHVLEVVAVTEE